MVIQCEQPFVSSLLNEEDPVIIFQNLRWNVIKVVPNGKVSEWNQPLYDVEIEIRKSFEQLRLFDL